MACEINTRNKFKQIVDQIKNDDIEAACATLKNYPATLDYNYGLDKFNYLLDTIRNLQSKKFVALQKIVEAGYEIYQKNENFEKLLFFAAAVINIETVRLCVSKLPNGCVNNIYQSDPILLFMFKFGNLGNEKIIECIKYLLEVGLDVNQANYKNTTPIMFLLKRYDNRRKSSPRVGKLEENIETIVKLFLEKNTVKVFTHTEEEILSRYYFINNKVTTFPNSPTPVDKKFLFQMLIDGNEKQFLKTKIKQFKDEDDGNNTLLQFCCENNLKDAVQYLIKNEANLNKVTNLNNKTPLELAARKNYEEIFDIILSTKRVKVEEELFTTFVVNGPKHIKTKYLEKLLAYKKINVNIQVCSTGNTPLHYALFQSHKEGISNLLKCGASLLTPNYSGKRPIDYITYTDLKTYLNNCILIDNYQSNQLAPNYEIALNYKNFVYSNNDSQYCSETMLLEAIATSDELRNLLKHPVIEAFVDMKWHLVRKLYQKLFALNILFYCLVFLLFMNTKLLAVLGVPIALAYSVKSYLLMNWKKNKLSDCIEFAISFLIFLSSVILNLYAVHLLGLTVAVLMAFSCHLFWRFSPKFAGIHATILILCNHLLIYAFYMATICAFSVLINHMTASIDFELFLNSSIYLNASLLFIFVFIAILFFSAIVINMWLGMQDDFNNSIKKHSFVLGNANVILFLNIIETMYLNFFVGKHIVDDIFLFDHKKSANLLLNISKKSYKKEKNRKEYKLNYLLNINKFTYAKLINFKLRSKFNAKMIKYVIKKQSN